MTGYIQDAKPQPRNRLDEDMQWLVSEFDFSNVAQIDNGNFAAEPLKVKKQPGRMPKLRKRKFLPW